MQAINLISLILLSVFVVSYFMKLAILYKKDKIKANVLGRAGKDRSIHLAEVFVKITSFAGVLLWTLETALSQLLSQFDSFLQLSKLFNFIGLLIMAGGVTFFILAVITMKNSWRVGIDKETKSSLITHGIYRYSRNPAFVGFNLMFTGLFLTFPGILTLLVLLANLISFHLLILQEERHLKESFGREYLKYIEKTPRYLVK